MVEKNSAKGKVPNLAMVQELVALAVSNNLQLLQVGEIRIVPTPKMRLDQNARKSEEARLTIRERENLALFGSKDEPKLNE